MNLLSYKRYTRKLKHNLNNNQDKTDNSIISWDYLFCIILLLVISLVMVYSASIAYSYKIYGNGMHFFIYQFLYIVIATLVGFLVFALPSDYLRDNYIKIIAVVIVLLVLVLIPHIGRKVNGSSRWINLFVLNIQPSELAKLGFAIFLSAIVANRKYKFKFSLNDLAKPNIGVFGLVYTLGSLLILIEPDMGSFIVITCICLSILLVSEFDLKYFIGAGSIIAIAAFFLVILFPYRLKRVTSFLNPWDDPFGKGYQLSHSLLAFSHGGITGLGLGNSIEKLLYLPEAHTDFILAVIGEELGAIGVLTIIAINSYMFYLSFFKISESCYNLNRLFQSYLVRGISVWFMMQMLFNIGVCLGAFPTKGLTLPFISFGGSSLLATIIAAAIILKIDSENRIMMRQRF